MIKATVLVNNPLIRQIIVQTIAEGKQSPH